MASSCSLGISPRLGSVRLTPDRRLGGQSWELCDSFMKALVVLGGAFVRRPVHLAGLVPVGCCPGRSAGRISACGSLVLFCWACSATGFGGSCVYKLTCCVLTGPGSRCVVSFPSSLHEMPYLLHHEPSVIHVI